MLKKYLSTETSDFIQIWRRECFHRVKYHLHRSVGFASGLVCRICNSSAGLFQGTQVLTPTIIVWLLQSCMPAQCPRSFLANAIQITVRYT